MSNPTKRTMHKVEAFLGKQIDSSKWEIPSGFATCKITGKLLPESALHCTFVHWVFDPLFLSKTGIHCEDTDPLSEQGLAVVMTALDMQGALIAYEDAPFHIEDFWKGRCLIREGGLAFSDPAFAAAYRRPVFE